MSSIYHNLKSDKQYKAATGLSLEQFDTLYRRFEKYYLPKLGNPYSHPVALTDKREALFFILHYFKSYPTLQNLGLYFGFAESTASHYLDYLKPALKAALHESEKTEFPLFTRQKDFEDAFAGVEDLFIDVTEVPTERPHNKQIQAERYSGKKKRTP